MLMYYLQKTYLFYFSLPYGSKPEYGNESRAVMPNQRAGWQHSSKHRNGGSKKHEHSSQYKKHS